VHLCTLEFEPVRSWEALLSWFTKLYETVD
jgi:hypothetical protein